MADPRWTPFQVASSSLVARIVDRGKAFETQLCHPLARQRVKLNYVQLAPDSPNVRTAAGITMAISST